jgi:DNA-binding transcriptional regulator YiaG
MDRVQSTREPIAHTTAGSTVSNPEAAGAAIGELRRISGLTWDQLARMFGVARRSLHFWASGKRMTPSNEEHLQRLLMVIRKIDRGSANDNRSAILTSNLDGTMPFDLLARGEYDQALNLLGSGIARRVPTSAVSGDAISARSPRPPHELLEALQDRIHQTSGRLISAKPLRIPRRK